MTSDSQLFEKTWCRANLIRKLTGAKAQTFASAGVGLLVWADVISVKVPFYFFYEAASLARYAASLAAAEALRIIPDIIDHFERHMFSIADTMNIMMAIIVFYLMYRFFKSISRALKKIRPTHWDIWPRFDFRRKMIIAFLLGTGIIVAWQFEALPWIISQFFELGRQMFGQLSLENISNAGEWLGHGFVTVYENKGTVLPAVKGGLAALATYATLEVTRVAVDLASPAIRLGHAIYNRAYPWLPSVKLSSRQIGWLHGLGSVTVGLVFGLGDLSFPSIPTWAWGALVPGLFLFFKERPNLASALSKVGSKAGRCLCAAAEFTLAQLRWAGGIAAGFVIVIAVVGYLSSSHPFIGFVIISGVIKAAYVGIAFALLIAAGRGLVSFAGHTRRAAGKLSVRVSEVWRDMLWVAATTTKLLSKTIGREQTRSTAPTRAEEQIAPGQSEHKSAIEVRPVPEAFQSSFRSGAAISV